MSWQDVYQQKAHTLQSAIGLIRHGQHLFVGSGAAAPRGLIATLVAKADHFADSQIGHIMTLGEAPYVDPRFAGRFRHNAYFIGSNTREAVNQGWADYTPYFSPRSQGSFAKGACQVDVALIQTTPPDEHGFVNLGVSVDVILAAIEAATLVIAEINPKLPVVRGDGYVRMDDIDAWVLHESELGTLPARTIDDTAREIGRNVARLVEDGSTIQVGIGQIPEATLAALRSKKDLGVWTEMLSDGIVDLVEAGVITGRHKVTDAGRVSASFALGSERTYRALHENPGYCLHPSDVINDPILISRQHKMVAINTALEVDLTGQVCSDSLGTQFYSGIGGQVDFIRGASMCPGGRPIIALRSTAKQGQVSRIVAQLSPGAGVVTSRGDVHYVVTEYGIADLHGRSIRERAMALLSIAHPDFRGELLRLAKQAHYVFQDQISPRSEERPEPTYECSHPEFGRLLIRSIRETDEQKMTDLFYSLSEETVRERWLNVVPSMSHQAIQRYLRADGRDQVALVVETVPREGEESRLLGVGSFHAGEDRWAELAMVVGDAWQRHGIDKMLLEQLTSAARRSKIRGFRVETSRVNLGLRTLLQAQGFAILERDDGDTMTLDIRLT